MCHYVQDISQFGGKFEQIQLKDLFQFQNKISAAVRQWNNKIQAVLSKCVPRCSVRNIWHLKIAVNQNKYFASLFFFTSGSHNSLLVLLLLSSLSLLSSAFLSPYCVFQSFFSYNSPSLVFLILIFLHPLTSFTSMTFLYPVLLTLLFGTIFYISLSLLFSLPSVFFLV